MATKKDSIQERRTQNASASQTGPGAARLAIPRRDLLTGAALVLAASASGCGSKLAPAGSASSGGSNPGSGSASSGGPCKHTHLLRTPFMDAFTDHFIGDPTKIKQQGCDDPWPDPDTGATNQRHWPNKGQGTNDILGDYVTFVNVLHTVAYAPMANITNPNPTLAAAIKDYLVNQQHWPNGIPPPAEYANEAATVTLVEIAVIQDRLLQAINSFDPTGSGKGGSGSNWPPH